MKFLKRRIADKSLLLLIEKFLRAGYIDDGLLVRLEKGTPQGSILSPLLANIYLHNVLDEWFNRVVKEHIDGYCEIIRYADDFVVVVQYAKEAVRIERALRNRFGKYGLELHADKSRIFSFGRYEKENAQKQNRKPNTFDFLGFTHYVTKTRNGFFKVGLMTSGQKFRQKCKNMNLWLKSIRNVTKMKYWWETLAKKLNGHYAYYGISGNSASISRFYRNTLLLALKWLNRRSQKTSMSWKGFYKYLENYPLPKPKIKYKLYELSNAK